MQNITLTEWSALAQIITTFITAIGIVASLFFSIKALREVQLDRKHRQRPHLAFECGGIRYPIHFVKGGRRIPGINPSYSEKILKHMPEDAESVRILEEESSDGSVKPVYVGELHNFGLGPALSTSVTWIPCEIWIGSERFQLDEAKQREFPYSKDINDIPTIPQHIPPGGNAGLYRLPTFIEKDFEKKISKVDGVLLIQAYDVFGDKHTTEQEYHIFTGYNETSPWIHITFSDLVLKDKHTMS